MARSSDRSDSVDGAFTISPSDTDDLTRSTEAINVSKSGVVAFVGVDGKTSDVYVAAGIAFPLRVKRVLATGTTAEGIRGLI